MAVFYVPLAVYSTPLAVHRCTVHRWLYTATNITGWLYDKPLTVTQTLRFRTPSAFTVSEKRLTVNGAVQTVSGGMLIVTGEILTVSGGGNMRTQCLYSKL